MKFSVFVIREKKVLSCIPVLSGAAGSAGAWREPAGHGERGGGGGGRGSSENKKEEGNQQQTRGDQIKRQQEISR